MTDLDTRSNDAQLASAILILRALDNQSTTASQLASALSDDPPICRRLLRLARSPMYGVTDEDITVERAVVLVGFQTIRSLAVLSAALSLTMGENGEDRWVSALTTGISTEQLALRVGVDGADGLVAGMLSRLVDVDGGAGADLARSVPPHIVAAMQVDEFARVQHSAPILDRLVHAGMAVARLMEAYAPGIPPSADVAAALEDTSFPGLADQRLATDIRRGIERYASLAG